MVAVEFFFVLGAFGRENVGDSKRVYSEAEKWRGRLVRRGEGASEAVKTCEIATDGLTTRGKSESRMSRQSWAICHKMAKIRAVSHAISEQTVSPLQNIGIRRWNTDSRLGFHSKYFDSTNNAYKSSDMTRVTEYSFPLYIASV